MIRLTGAAWLAVSLLGGAGAATAQEGWATPEELASLSGTYRSAAVEPWSGGFGTREFVLNGGQWSLTFIHALDPGMTMRTFQFRTGGAYEVGEPSEAVAGAYRTVFNEDWKHLTLLTADPQVAAGMGMAECGLPVNLETDISETGCAAWPPVAACGQEHDLLAMDAGGVYFGARPADNDMCSADKTPTALLPAVVAR